MRFVIPVYLLICVIAVVSFFAPHDDTDAPGSRSGLAIYVDYKTGCEYLGRTFGGLTPRLNVNGSAVCGIGR